MILQMDFCLRVDISAIYDIITMSLKEEVLFLKKTVCLCSLLFVFFILCMVSGYARNDYGIAITNARLSSFINNPGNNNMSNAGNGNQYALLKNGQGIGVHVGSAINVSDVMIMLASSDSQIVVIHTSFYSGIDPATGRGTGSPIATIRQRHWIDASPTLYSAYDLACVSTNSETAQPYTKVVKNVECIEVVVQYRTKDELAPVHIYQVLPFRRYKDSDSKGRYILDLRTATAGTLEDETTHVLRYRDHAEILCYFSGGRPATTNTSDPQYYATTNSDVAEISTFSTGVADYVKVIAKKKGTAKLTVTRKESWQYEAITRTYTFKVRARPINAAEISASYKQSIEYNGKERSPEITLTDTYNTADGFPKTLTEGTHFTVAYSDNTNAGIMSIEVTGDGDYYTSSKVYNTEITPRVLELTFTAENKIYDGTNGAVGNFSLEKVVSGDEVMASGTCTFSDAVVGENKTVTAKKISLNGADSGNYSIAETATATANIDVNTGLSFSYTSPYANHADESALSTSFAEACQNAGITLPGTYTAGYAGGTYGMVTNGSYNRNNTYRDVLGVLNDRTNISLIVSDVVCATGTAQITTGSSWVYGTNGTEHESGTNIISYANAGAWSDNGTVKTIATGTPESFTVRVYLKKGEWLLIDTDIGIYHGRVDVAVHKTDQHYATDKIDCFFPVSYQDDYRVSKLQLASNSAYNETRKDYWSNLNPFVAEESGVYTFTFTVTGSSYLLDTVHGLGSQYGKNPQNAPANAPVTTVRKLTIDGTEIYGIDAM